MNQSMRVFGVFTVVSLAGNICTNLIANGTTGKEIGTNSNTIGTGNITNEPPRGKTNNLQTQISFAVTAKLISTSVFTTRIVQFLLYLNLEFQASSSFLCLYRPICVGPGRKPHCWFSHEVAQMLLTNGTIGRTHNTRTVNRQKLKVVDKFTYPGRTLSRAVHIDDVTARIAKASVTFGRLRAKWNQARHQAESIQGCGIDNPLVYT